MLNRGTTAALLTLALAVGASIAGATAAHGAANPGVVHYTDSYVTGQGWSCTFDASSLRMNPGDTFSITTTTTVDGAQQPSTSFLQLTGPGTSSNIQVGDNLAAPVTLSALGTYTVASTDGCSFTVTVVAEPVPAPPAHDEFQQVGVPASGSCNDVPGWVGHYPGYPIGGWSKSWAQWINNGAGGPVCTREVEERPDGTIVLVG